MKYTIFGIYAESLQRHADIVEAANARAAEKLYRREMRKEGYDMLVAAVVEGEVKTVDDFVFANQMA